MKAIFVSGLLVAGHILLDHTIGSNHWLKQFAASTGEYDQELRGHKHFFYSVYSRLHRNDPDTLQMCHVLVEEQGVFFGRIANAIPEVVGTSVL